MQKKVFWDLKSKLPNCKYTISDVIMRKGKPDKENKVLEFNIRVSKFCNKNKIDIIEHKNLDGSCLSFKKLHLNKGNSYLANNLLGFLHSFWFGKSLPASPKTVVPSLEGLYNLRAFYPKKMILSYINVNSIRNNLDDLKFLLGKIFGHHMHLRNQIGWNIPDGPICNRRFEQTLPSGYHINFMINFMSKQCLSKLIKGPKNI